MPRTAGPTQPSVSPEDHPTSVARVAPNSPSRPGGRNSQRSNVLPVPSASQNEPPDVPTISYPCPYCDRTFPSAIGLGVHRRHAHPDEANAAVGVQRVKRRWGDEELRLMAREEALALSRGVGFMNQHLADVFPDRTLDAIKGVRRRADYKDLVAAASRELDAAALPSIEEERLEPGPGSTAANNSQHSPLPDYPNRQPLISNLRTAIEQLIPAVRNVSGFRTSMLIQAAMRCLDGHNVMQECCTWMREVFPPLVNTRSPRQRVVEHPARISRKRQRRREYARIQKLYKTNMSRAAKLIMDGPTGSVVPDIRAMSGYWETIFTQPSIEVPQGVSRPRLELESIWQPVTVEDIIAVGVSISSAPGPDGVTTRQWRAVPACVRALLYNIVLAVGGFPQELLASRTVFVPKKPDSSMPADYRPISVASVVVRQLHKILAKRLREAGLVDLRQRCFDDGCAENIAVLAALLDDSKRHLRELHVVSLDVAKAFDSVSHSAISGILGRIGLPVEFTNYISHCYANSTTVLEVGGDRSASISVLRGVRQGDPLSTIVFCLVVNDILSAVSDDVGYGIGGVSLVNALAYADDILLVSSSKRGMASSIRAVEAKARELGLEFNSSKSVALSVVPAGKQKTYKVLADPQFHLADGSNIPQLRSSQEWRYLGIDIRPIGPKRVSKDITPTLDRITRAPLKPQQRLKILRCFLIPRYYHRLVLSGTTLKQLKSLDKQVRLAVRKWLRLPHDVPLGYFHTPVSLGGLGIPAFSTTVPGLMYERLSRLAQSSSPQVRAVSGTSWVSSKLDWCLRVLTKEDGPLLTKESREKWWAGYLYRTVDGRELREAGKSTLSTWWVDGGSHGVPGRDYVQYHHVRVNCLPTRIRTSRGIRRAGMQVRCRAGCRVAETAAHVIQNCHRTHGGRVRRHNAVCKVLASGLRNARWDVQEEPQFRTAAGLRKPDLVAVRTGTAVILDAQVVSGSTALDDAHERKKQYYAGNDDIIDAIADRHTIERSNIKVSTCTLSWRGIWASRSADFLLNIGLPRRLLAGITTRVLQGSHMNWNRWNRMTGLGNMNVASVGLPRTGVG